MTAILQNVSFFFIANVAARGLGVVKAFWLARILDPGNYGVWVFLLLLSAFVPILSLGTIETLMKKVPFFRGKGDSTSVRETEEAVFSFMLLVAIVVFCAAFPSGSLLKGGPYQRYAVPVQLMFLAVGFSLLSAFFFYRLQSYQRFDLASTITTARSFLVLVCQIPLSYVLGLTGVFLGFLASEVLVFVCSVLLNRNLPTTIALRFRPSLYAGLIRTGLPITIVWWTYMIQTSVDRLVSMTMLGEAPTGYYGIGMSIAAAFLLLPDAVNQVLYPSINEEYGRTMSSRNLAPLVVDPARIVSVFLPFLACVSVVILPFIFTVIVPKYSPGLVAAQLLIVAALYSGLMRGGANFLVSTDKQWLLLVYIAGCIATNLFGSVLLVKLGLGIAGIAVSTVVSSALLSVVTWASVFRALGSKAKDGFVLVLDLFVPALLFTLLAIGNQVFFRSVAVPSQSYFALIAVEIVVYWCVLFAMRRYRKLVIETMHSLFGAIANRMRDY